MKNFICEYLRLIGYTVVGLVFAYCSFYLLINLYHQRELANTMTYSAQEDTVYNSVMTKIEDAKNKINQFQSSDYTGAVPVHQLLNIQGRLQICTRQFENDTFLALKDKKELTILDVEELRKSLQNDVLNSCMVEQLYDLAVADETDRFDIPTLRTIAPYLELDIKNLLASNNYLTSDYQSNHIYYFTTSHSRLSFFDKLKLGYAEVIATYNRAADLLVEISNWFEEEVSR